MNCNTVSTVAAIGINCHQPEGWTVASQALKYPCGVAVDGDGNAIVADSINHRIRKITPQGQVSTLAGTGEKGHRDGEGFDAQFNSLCGLAVDGDDNVIVADSFNCRYPKNHTTGPRVHSGGHWREGPSGRRRNNCSVLDHPRGIAVDGDGNVIVADTLNFRIRKITPQGHASTLAGTGGLGHRDGEGTVALFKSPCAVAMDGDGNVVVADTLTNCIRKITPQGHVCTLLPPLLKSSFASDIQHHVFDSSSIPDVCFVVEQEHIPGNRSNLSDRCKYFRSSMFGDGFKEGDSAEIPIEGTSSAAFKALLEYRHTDSMEVDDAVFLDLAKLCDQY
jgi:hypothetical protein